MTRILQGCAALVLALAFGAAVPGTIAGVSATCSWGTSARSDQPLYVQVRETCSDPADTHVDDAALVGPATVHFYSGPDTEWIKMVRLPLAGTYELTVTFTVQMEGRPVTGTGTCCSILVYGEASTPTPAPTEAPTAPPSVRPTARPTARPTTRPTATKRPTLVTSTATAESVTATAAESATVSASASPPPAPASVATLATRMPAATPSSTTPWPEPAAPSGGPGSMAQLAGLGAAGLLGLSALSSVLMVAHRKRRKTDKPAIAPGPGGNP